MTRASLYERFLASAERTPDMPALSDSTTSYTYAELDRAASATAKRLLAYRLPHGSPIALSADRSAQAVVAMLACLRAECAYVPYDPAWPAERLAHLRLDSGARLDLDPRTGQVSLVRQAAPDDAVVPDLAYIIYTSGTTGKPKGVPITHKNALQMLDNTLPLFDLAPGDAWSLFHALTFDFSVWEMWGAFLTGGHVAVVGRKEAASPAAMRRFVADYQIKVLSQVPSVFGLGADEHIAGLKSDEYSLKYLVFGGEVLQPDVVARVHATTDRVRVINMYGITEATVHATFKPLDETDVRAALATGETPIGLPLGSHIAALNDPRTHPDGSSTGELLLAGDSITAGYLNSPSLNADRFLTLDDAGHHMRYFRTGDLVRRRPDGSLTYLRRADGQLKVLGYRIEASEVELAVRGHPAVRNCAVVVAGSRPRLVALFTRAGAAEPSSIRASLVDRLPAYMIPHHFLEVDELPITSNGKFDRDAATRLAIQLLSSL